MRWCPGRIGLDKQVNVVWHDLQGMNNRPKFGRFLGNQVFEPLNDWAFENRAAELGAPDQVVFQDDR
jgi:hypothetical protein